MIVVTSPNANNFKRWMGQNGAMGIVMNCPDESDVRALCVWMKRNEQGEQNGYWKQVKERMDEVGPILRVIFDGNKFTDRKTDIDQVINDVDSSNAKHYVGVMSDKLWNAANPSHKLVQIVRVRKDLPTEIYLNSPASRVIASKIYIHLSTKMHFMEIFKLLMHPDVILLSIVLEMSGTVTFMCRGAVNIIIGKLKELKPPEGRALQLAALQRNPEGHPTEAVGLPTKQGLPLEKNFARYKVMYKPAYPTFPLVDAFFFMESPRRTLVGLQMTTAHDHHTKTSTVKQFTEYLSWFFTNWEEFAQGLSWDIIYVQHADSKPMENWQRCDYVNPRSREEKKIVAFWDKKVRQYQFILTPEDIEKLNAIKESTTDKKQEAAVGNHQEELGR
ncbi:putative retrotransposon hot spot (RHS) protein [Trypanosoma cruzi]|uniref:Putative retrotransposon hot spot (RHS) protein n=1 Tax=Trypanosoma cruzi TaxID=5693 RepID=A0A2V2WMQ9_TRYCR|nr:putative retrotransposon hot spot (RHS) protein [Trypanosoma cruzi]